MNPQQTHRRFFAILLLALATAPALAIDDYTLGPDSQPQENVPKGVITKHHHASNLFAGAQRDYWVYVPQKYDPNQPTPVMIFQDGGGFQNPTGGYRVPIVLDNLIYKKELPPMIAIFINPGVIPAPNGSTAAPDPLVKSNPPQQTPRFNRSFEYDSPTDLYARFLLEEILPEVARDYNLSKNGNDRGLCGSSSGGIAAFTAAWERPTEFTRVISFIGSFSNLRGGHSYPTMIRKTEPKPIRVFLQDGSNDLDNFAGSWWLANQEMAAALKFAGYDYTFAPGDGQHSGKHGGSILPDALRFIWRDYPNPVTASLKNSKQPIVEILIGGEGWQLVGEGFRFTEGPAADDKGNVFFTDIPNKKIHKIDPDGKISVFVADSGSANGLKFGPDGKLYAAQNGNKKIVAYDADGKETVIANDIESNDLVVTFRGGVYVTDPGHRQVWYIPPGGEKEVVDTGLNFPNGITLTPDQTQLIVADMRSQYLYAFTIQPDGSLINKQPFFTLHVPLDKTEGNADGICADNQGRVYATSHLGLQVFDPAGRVNCIINKPQNKWLANVCFGGKDLDWIYVACSDKIYRRHVKAKGILYFQGPSLPPTPRL
jgi:gluconolactonase